MTSAIRRWLEYRRLSFAKLAALAAIYTVVVIVPLAVHAIMREGLRERFGQLWWLLPAGMFGLLAAAGPVVYLVFLQRIEDQMLRDQRRYHRTLIAASSGMTRIKDLAELSRLIVHVVNRTVRLTHAALFLFNPKEQHYELKAMRNRQMFPSTLTIEATDPLIEILQGSRDLLLLDELHDELEGRQPDTSTQRTAWAYSWMRKLEARLIVPSFSNERLLAFLVLGAKRSGERYTTDDIAIFSGLANQAALAIENAMFFEELKTNEAYMIQSEKLASLGQLASGMAHEIHNPLTIISGEAQLYLERAKGKDPEVDQVLHSIIEECHRAADITRRILRFAKPAPSELNPVDLKTTVEESLTLAGYQVRMERVERTVRIPADLPKVRGNHNQLQEVLLNLILNACQAMGNDGGRLDVSAEVADRTVELRVRDTGPGIARGKLPKIFDPFYTTKHNGTGLGLFVSQRIVQAHGGSIGVVSTEGKGTTFTIRLPIWQNDAAAQASKTTLASSS